MVKMMTVQREKRTARPQTEGRGTPHTLQPQPKEMANKTVNKGQQALLPKATKYQSSLLGRQTTPGLLKIDGDNAQKADAKNGTK